MKDADLEQLESDLMWDGYFVVPLCSNIDSAH